MKRFLASFSRITVRTGFLAAALFLGLVFWYLPNFLDLDGYRPQLTDLLQKTFHCRVMVGQVRGELIPYPGLVLGHVVFLEPEKNPRVLASVDGIHLWISKKALLEGHLRFWAVRFRNPRFILHREKGQQAESRWAALELPTAESSGEKTDVDEWEVTNGKLEIWDHTVSPTSKWVIDRLSGSFRTLTQSGALEGRTPHLGPQNIFELHYDRSAVFPIEARFINVEWSALASLMQTRIPTFNGSADFTIRAQLSPVLLLHAMVHQRSGSGSVAATAQRGTHGDWRWFANGTDFSLDGTDFQLPRWSARGDSRAMTVLAHAMTREGGTADVSWKQASHAREATLGIEVSSVTVRQVLEIFDLESKIKTDPARAMNPYGYESWLMTQASMQAILRSGGSLDVKEGHFDIAGMHLDLTGTFPLTKEGPPAHIQGSFRSIPVAAIVESFFSPPSPITGVGQIDFIWTFPLSDHWVQGLSGPFTLQINNGVLHLFKTFYRIMSILSLDNYLRLRLPEIQAKGIVFESVAGHLSFQNGVLSSDDLFLKSHSMNIGMKGTLDLPQKRVKTTVRLEMLRFLEDIFKVVPITHWIFKKPNKILFPLVVSVEGPWDNVEVK